MSLQEPRLLFLLIFVFPSENLGSPHRNTVINSCKCDRFPQKDCIVILNRHSIYQNLGHITSKNLKTDKYIF